jgi:hypothetical protein
MHAHYSEPMTTVTSDLPAVRPSWHWSLPAALVAAASILLTWAAQGLPPICPAVFPAPPSCAVDARLGPAVSSIVFLVLLLASMVITGAIISPARRERALRIFLLAVVIAAVVAPLWTFGASGFQLL